MSPVDITQLDAIRAAAKKKFGEETIHNGSIMPAIYKVPFDSVELNLATFGGAAMGRMMQLWGGPSSGKTLSAWGIVKMAQQISDEFFPDGLHTTYYNVEGTYDPVFTRQLGVDTDRVEIIDCNIIEDIGRHVEAMFLASHIHIIDSTSFAESELEARADLGDSRPAADARAWKQVLRHLERVMDKGEPSDGNNPGRPGDNMVILISHETVDFKTNAIKPVSGKTIGHASSMTLHYRQAKKLYRSSPGERLTDTRPQKGNDPLTGGHRINGAEIEIEVTKSKVCRPFGKARRTLDYDTLQFDNAAEMFKSGVFLGVIEKSNNHYTFPGHDKAIHGAPAAAEFLANDMATVSAILRACEEYYKTGGVREVGQ